MHLICVLYDYNCSLFCRFMVIAFLSVIICYIFIIMLLFHEDCINVLSIAGQNQDLK